MSRSRAHGFDEIGRDELPGHRDGRSTLVVPPLGCEAAQSSTVLFGHLGQHRRSDGRMAEIFAGQQTD
jgi:hypothetical protein